MKPDFSIPQRQSKLGTLILFVYALQKNVRGFLALFIIWGVSFSENYKKIAILLAVFIVFSFLEAFIRYYFFTFQIDFDTKELIIQKGFLNKSKISIQLNKIQQINLNQTLLHKIFGLYEIQADTAGSDKKEAEIKVVSQEIALHFKQTIDFLNEDTFTERQTEQSEIQQEKQIKIDFATLVKTGLTSRYVETFAWFITLFFAFLDSIQEMGFIDSSSVTHFVDITPTVFIVFALAITAFVLVILVNLIRTTVRYFGFTITKNKNSMVLHFGLFTTRNTIINPKKVQIFKISQNFLQRRIDIQNLRIEQASSEAGGNEKRKDRIEIPGCSETVKEQFFDFIYGKSVTDTTVFLPHIRKFWLHIAFFVVLPVLAVFSFNTARNIMNWEKLVALAVIFVIFGSFSAWRKFKNSKLMVTPHFIVIQSGFWDIDTAIIEPYKIQAVQIRQFFWQKKADIGSITLHTAGGIVSFSTASYSQLAKLCNEWLYTVETSTKKWI